MPDETMGTVHLVGAGPGDPELLTLRAARVLSAASVVLYDRLVDDRVLQLIGEDVERIDVGKYPEDCAHRRQARIHGLMAERASRGERVVRLKGGDPFVFGRGGEEVLAMRGLGIRVEVVPGITSAVAAPAAIGIPVTSRGLAEGFGVFTGRRSNGASETIDWAAAARLPTGIFLMGVRELGRICAQMIRCGRAGSTPVAVVERAHTVEQRSWVGTLSTITERAHDAQSPAVIVIGDVVRLSDAWLEFLAEVDANEQVRTPPLRGWSSGELEESA